MTRNDWSIVKSDAGMGEHEYFIFYKGDYLATTNDERNAEMIIKAVDYIANGCNL